VVLEHKENGDNHCDIKTDFGMQTDINHEITICYSVK
jgi:hypothetical protein